jgi:hypothetical protein
VKKPLSNGHIKAQEVLDLDLREILIQFKLRILIIFRNNLKEFGIFLHMGRGLGF